MNIRPKIRNVALMGALAAVAATAWATNETTSNATYVPSHSIAAPAEAVEVKETLSPSETIVAPAEPTTTATAAEAQPAPVAEASITQPRVTVEERRLTVDERIQAEVMDRIASSMNVSGKIGVESRDAKVTLTGYTSTAGQAWRVERAARGVDGVKEVQNLIRARVGGSV